MKEPLISPIAQRIIALLTNVAELINISNERKDAKDVMEATILYAQAKKFPIPDNKVEVFYYKLMDARANTLYGIVMDIAKDVINYDIAQKKLEVKNKADIARKEKNK